MPQQMLETPRGILAEGLPTAADSHATPSHSDSTVDYPNKHCRQRDAAVGRRHPKIEFVVSTSNFSHTWTAVVSVGDGAIMPPEACSRRSQVFG